MKDLQASWKILFNRLGSCLKNNKERKRKIFPNFPSISTKDQKDFDLVIKKISLLCDIPEKETRKKFIKWISTLPISYEEGYTMITEGNNHFLNF